MHIQLDAIGGISGDMFIGALLDVWPELAASLPQQLAQAGFAELVALHIVPHHDGILGGTRVQVEDLQAAQPAPLVQGLGAQRHPHRAWREIRALLQASALDAKVLTHALGIFTCLAEAEAAVHGTAVDDVDFHEVGAWDSIADIVCAAALIAASGATSWSVSSLPLGRGRVASAHGELPVPAPAVVVLLQGFAFHDDGRDGERVTPTGAAILRYLCTDASRAEQPRVLRKSGHGFGQRRFAGLSNVLRVLVFADSAIAAEMEQDSISVLSFEVDDQSPEDLALGLETVRRHPGVIDVVQYPVLGKKQRGASSVRVLARLSAEAEVQHLCFMQTTTLGLRIEHSRRTLLPRLQETVELDGRSYRVKLAWRPDGELSAKAELQDLAQLPLNQAERQLLREMVEGIALQRHNAVPASKVDGEQDD
jgi:uncharacterized protein (TIGR00299 family) protein